MIDRLKLFLEQETYSFILDIYNFHLNGYIVEIDEDKVWFNDDKLGKIPIRLNDIKTISYSNKKRDENGD